MADHVKKDLRAVHFQLGYDKPTLTTTQGEVMVAPKGMVKAALDPALAKDLRAVHFSFGSDGGWRYATTSSSDYVWPSLAVETKLDKIKRVP
jgi:hypothetical protein